MRILIIHNRYQDRGGEDLVAEQEADLLAGSETVETFISSNRKGFAGLLQFLGYPCNLRAVRRLRKVVERFRPDLVHLHNIHYATGPTLIRYLHRQGIPMVMTLHNYRLICPSATLFYKGRKFTKSIHSSFPWKAIRLGVHQGSVLKTCWIAWTYYLHRKLGTWNQVDRYLILTDFARNLFLRSQTGISPEKFSVKPNFILDQGKNKTAIPREDHFLFVGRLSEEKGIRTLIEAVQRSGAGLRIAGDGPLRAFVEQVCSNSPRLTYLGALDPDQVRQQMQQCNALIFPSEWYEGMPMTLIEAFATGTATIASRLGAMSSMIREGSEGLLFNAGDSADLTACLDQWNSLDPQEKDRIRRQARQHYEQHYTAEANKAQLLQIYRELTPKISPHLH